MFRLKNQAVMVLRISSLLLVCLLTTSSAAWGDANQLELFPDLNHSWGSADYEQVVKLFSSGEAELLKIDNPLQKKIFDKLVATENLEPSKDHSIGINDRLQEFVRISKSNAEILKLYGMALNKGENFGPEGARLLAFSLRLSRAMIYIMDEFLPSVPRDQGYMARLIGKEQMRLGIIQQLSGAVGSLADRKTYSESDLALLLGALSETIPDLKKLCTAEMRDELKRLVFESRGQFRKPADQKNAEKILTSLADYKS